MKEETTHFTSELFDFLRELKENNNRAWFQANKARYEAVVQDPAVRFIRDASVRLKKISPHVAGDPRPYGGSMTRIYRDIRFSPDKSPYKAHIGIHFRHAEVPKGVHAPGYFLYLQPGESGAYAGVWQPDPPGLKKIRDRIVAEPEAWRKVLRSKVELEGESLVRPPAGYDPKHPFIQDIRRKDFVAGRSLRETDIASSGFLDRFIDACASLDPLNAFLARALGLPW